MNSRAHRWSFLGTALVVARVLGQCGAADLAPATGGLILHLDAAAQVQAGGAGPGNNLWRNLAEPADQVAGSAALHNLGSDGSSGWTGSGTREDPYALQFDSQKTYATGPGNLELPEITIEAWARADGHTLRGATLIGNDFGTGGISLMALPAAGSLMLLHGTTFTPIGAEVSRGEWHQVVLAWKDGTARFYVDGAFACSSPAPRALQSTHYHGYNLGAARFPEHDYAAADGLKGCIGLIRVYNRVLSAAEVRGNFEVDVGRFPIRRDPLREVPVSSIPAARAGSEQVEAHCAKWDYYYHRVAVTSTAKDAPYAFDGYPTSITQPIEFQTCQGGPPVPGKPVEFIVNYHRPVAVTRFVHFPSRLRELHCWQDADIYSSDDNESWTLRQSLTNLPPDPVQYLGFDKPVLARFYKLAIKSMSDASSPVNTQEIETYYGTTIGNVNADHRVQSESCRLAVRVVSPDAPLEGAELRLVSPAGSLSGEQVAGLPAVATGGAGIATLRIVPRHSGRIPIRLELYAGKRLVDQRPYTLIVQPKLAFSSLTPGGAVTAQAGQEITVSGVVANPGATMASHVTVSWVGRTADLGDLAPGESANFRLSLHAQPGYAPGELIASAAEGARTVLRRAILCPSGNGFSVTAGQTRTDWRLSDERLRFSAAPVGGETPITGSAYLRAAAKPCLFVPVETGQDSGTVAAVIPGAVFLARVEPANRGDPSLRCKLVLDDPNPLVTPWLDLELQLAVDEPKILFRPHIDWYTVEHGPNFPDLACGLNSTTRMLCTQTAKGTLSMVPDTDNLQWGFSPENRMTARFQIALAPYDDLHQGIWLPVSQSPAEFAFTLPVRTGDWWEAYRYVVEGLFHFEQPRQWAMPITQMQMLTVRELLSYQAWCEKWQNVRVYSNDQVFWPFYATAYTLPAMYSWYLATDDQTAKVKSEKVIDWLLRVQHPDPPMQGGWFTAYWSEGDPPKMVGTDFIHNRWLVPHGTGAAVKTLLWYWKASGRKDRRTFSAARRGCDWLLRTMRDDGGWPYAFDLEGKRLTDQCGAGQIWCTWALWEMYGVTGETKYRDAALKSKDFFRKTYMDLHRYVGYWEDTVGITKEQNQKIHSWECYEAALACLAFSEMGDKALALEAAKDTATWSWTRVINTRQYETSYGQTTEQALCGPSQAQSPMIAVALHQIYENTGDKLWSDFSGAVKAVNFAADPDQEYGMVATSGWSQPLTGVTGPPYDNVRPFVTPDMGRQDYGRQLWTGWCTDQFAWLALNWLIREANLRAPQYVNVDPDTLRGTVLGSPGRIKMPEERCDVNGIDHIDINWVGCSNDDKYVLLIMNHKEECRVMVRPHEAHLDVLTRPPRLLVGQGPDYEEAKPVRNGVQYQVAIPAGKTALLIWERIK